MALTFRTFMLWWLLLTLLASLAIASTAFADDKEAGKAVFARVCESCHGVAGSGGQGPALVPLTKDLSELVAIVRQGVGLMPSIPKADITDAEIAQVHAFLKSLGEKHAEHIAARGIVPRVDGGRRRGRLLRPSAAPRANTGSRAPAGH